MYCITKITNRNNKIAIYHSDNVIDKITHYDIQFNSFYSGYFDYFVPKNIVQSKKTQIGHLTCIMYLSSEKFYEEPEKWIEQFKEAYRNKFGGFKWYRELTLD